MSDFDDNALCPQSRVSTTTSFGQY